ncbi:MAG: hypothetical protein JJD93_03365 [Ilumatobacteraceae bacterium]|nr:hypothetical protein [Ilumatobacteraceae bacterium]
MIASDYATLLWFLGLGSIFWAFMAPWAWRTSIAKWSHDRTWVEVWGMRLTAPIGAVAFGFLFFKFVITPP